MLLKDFSQEPKGSLKDVILIHDIDYNTYICISLYKMFLRSLPLSNFTVSLWVQLGN